jgi:hypothetical protein
MSIKDLDRVHKERVDGAMKRWKSDDRPIAPSDLFVSERVVETIGADKILLPSYDRQKILAGIPFSPVTYVTICRLCIREQNFPDFQKLAKSRLVVPVLLGPYESYPEKLVEFLLTVDHVSAHEYRAYRFAKINETTKQAICLHCADKRIKAMVANVRRRKGAPDFRTNIDRLIQSIWPFVSPDYTLLDQAVAACKSHDLGQLNQLVQLGETIYNIRSAQALGAPITVDDEALSDIPAGISTESDEGIRLLAQMRKFAADGLGLSFPTDIPLDRYLELAKDYQPAISNLVEYTGLGKTNSIADFSKRISSLNLEIERIQGLKRYVMLEASMALVRQHKGMVFTTILAGALGLAGAGWLGCGGAVAASAGVKAAKKSGLLSQKQKSQNLPAERLGRMIARDLQPYLSKLIAGYVSSSPAAVNVLFLRKKIQQSKAA